MAQDTPRKDAIRYDLLVQDALRKVVKGVLADTAKHGLPGEHHFFITFDTRAPGVKLSPRMLKKYPESMNVVLQHVFWDLTVNDELFEVGLSFGGVGEKLTVPFNSVTAFFDPSVEFGLKFELRGEMESAEAAPALEAKRGDPPPRAAQGPKLAAVPKADAGDGRREVPAAPGKDGGKSKSEPATKEAAKVVSIDAFRKKP